MKVMLLPSVCLFDCPLDYSKSYELITVKFFGNVGRGPKNIRLDFDGDPELGPNPGIFKVGYSLLTVAMPIDRRHDILGGGLSSLGAFSFIM